MFVLGSHCFAELPPVEGENGPPSPPVQRWKFRPQEPDSDDQYQQWRFKSYSGSDKQLGSPKDAAAINALVPGPKPAKLCWISRSIVVVISACRFDALSNQRRCFYVLEKHRSKWSITHHYRLRNDPLV
jgi:hypothetical protein